MTMGASRVEHDVPDVLRRSSANGGRTILPRGPSKTGVDQPVLCSCTPDDASSGTCTLLLLTGAGVFAFFSLLLLCDFMPLAIACGEAGLLLALLALPDLAATERRDCEMTQTSQVTSIYDADVQRLSWQSDCQLDVGH